MTDPHRSRAAPAAIEDLISGTEHALGALYRHAQGLARIEALLAGLTGPELAARFQVANVRQDRLILVTPTAAWATRLRMLAPQMLRLLETRGLGNLKHIDLRVAPIHRDAPQRKSRRQLSPAAQQALDQMRRLCDR